MENYECTISIESIDSKDNYKVEVHDDKEKETLFYKEEDKTITSFDYKNNILTRDNEKMKLTYYFLLNYKTKNKIFIKDLNNEVEVEVITRKLEKTDNYIEVVYEIDNNKFTYRIEKEMKI